MPSTNLATSSTPGVNLFANVPEKVRRRMRSSKAKATLRAYKTDWKDFTAWCNKMKADALPASPASVATYLDDLADRLSVSTVGRRLAAISFAHRLRKLPNPAQFEEVRLTVQGIRNEKCVRPERKRPVDFAVLKRMIAAISGPTLREARDRALILLGYATALRRENIAALQVGDLRWRRDRVDVLVQRSKTDQQGEGQVIGVVATGTELCPVRAVRTWLERAGIRSGFVFRGMVGGNKGRRLHPGRMPGEVVASAVQNAAELAGFDPTEFGGHSLRAGHVTQAIRNRASLPEVMKTTGHRRVETLMKYIREEDTVRGSSAARIWPSR
ncbi:MAG: tyrosine-type recombinase/integrase [Myxococcaceae bacterium]